MTPLGKKIDKVKAGSIVTVTCPTCNKPVEIVYTPERGFSFGCYVCKIIFVEIELAHYDCIIRVLTIHKKPN